MSFVNKKVESIKQEVEKLYAQSKDESMRAWFFKGHVMLVANYGKEVAEDVGADVEIVVLAALFHDIARVWEIDDDPELMNESLKTTREVMIRYGYSDSKIKEVEQAILHHSCRETLPQTEEGKVLSTADAMAHFLSEFFLILPVNCWLNATDNFEEYKSWVKRKIERDFHKKIFYPKYRAKVRKKYEALKTVFNS